MIKPIKKRKPLTDRETKVLGELLRLTKRDTYQPSEMELAHTCGLSCVHWVLKAIEKKGFITLTGKARSIKIPEDLKG